VEGISVALAREIEPLGISMKPRRKIWTNQTNYLRVPKLIAFEIEVSFSSKRMGEKTARV
jgi:hypothetical protein